MDELERKQILGDLNYKLLQVDYRGKPLKSVTGLRGMVKLWALQNTNGKKVSYIADNSGKVIMIVRGTGKNFPDVLKDDEVPDDLYLTESKTLAEHRDKNGCCTDFVR